MNKKSVGVIVGLVIVGLVVCFLIYRLVAALLGLMSGAIDFVIGLVVVIALAALVIWMFAYAKKKR